MDRDNRGQHGEENNFEDETRYDDNGTTAVREEEYAAGQEEWDQPLDEFAEEENVHEEQPKKDPFAEEGPLEDDYVQHADDGQDLDDGEMHEDAQPRQSATMAGMKNESSSLMKYLPMVGGALAVAVLGFFGFQQFMGTPSDAPAQPSLDNQNTWDMNAQNGGQNNTAAVQQPEPIQQPDNTEQPANPTSNNVITPVASPVVEQPANTQATAQLESRIVELTQQLEQMKQTQGQLEQKLQTAAATPPSMDEASKAATKAFEDRIAQLEQKLSAATSSASVDSPSVDAPSKASSRAAKRAAARQQAADEAPVEEKTTRSARKASTDFMVAKKPRTVRKQKAARAKVDEDGFESSAPTRSFQGWILRSAQPGSAWLSQGAYSSDLRRVVPGDKVQGLGTITSVRQIAGRWVVEGTQGAVR